jgi:bacillithiol biosynthesis cysteine-adding enzyme BshC
LDRLAPALQASGAARERLDRAAEQGVVVTTGQQPGLFGGPMYTWSKAVGALAFADALEAAIDLPVAPIFWAATDDADWMEAAVTYVATARGLLRASLVGPPTDGLAMADVPLGDLTDARAPLDAASGSAAHASILELLDRLYVPQATIGDSYLSLLRALLEPLGIAVLDASHEAVRQAADPLLRQALRHSAAIQDALHERSVAIEAAGFSPQVDVVDGRTLVFQSHLRAVDHGVAHVRERVLLADAVVVAREAAPGTLGPNVLLRPIVEGQLLPTVCYLAGPGELAYFAQVAPVARVLDVPAPVVAPRCALDVVPRAAMDELAAQGLDASQLLDPHAAEQVTARQLVPDPLADGMDRLRTMIDAQVRLLGETIMADGSLVAPTVVEGLSRELSWRVDRFERRVLAGVKQREQHALQKVEALRAMLRPLGRSPERVLNLMPYLARFGPQLLLDMRDAARPHAEMLVQGGAEHS